tara:strand:+ start:5225 stop:5872 length:648 start_codon:yes stop_codon:yes gene_type:complete
METEERIATIENYLDSGSYDASENQALIAQVKTIMVEHPELRVKLGPLIGRLKAVPQVDADVDVNWVDLLSGSLAIGHRPRIKSLKTMKSLGATHILTLLSEKEGAKDIGKAAKKQGLQWIWLPLSSAEPPAEDRLEEITEVFKDSITALGNGAKIYVHCSAGIHRTGMFSYALFRYMGFDVEQSESLLSALREVTSREVGDHRKLWGDSFFHSD